jgi:exopolyphosphatase / guanosine-5'-triphosphate,3'-diphosphate pyrophosphatase
MAHHFAVLDVGSNAIRSQIAAVDHPQIYRVVEQGREPVRLGHGVFQSRRLDPAAVESAIKTILEFKELTKRYRVKSIKAAGTSALREAADGKAFQRRVQKLGIPLEVISEQEEARLISLGLMSGLRFRLPLGFFVDIGGGSVELSVANTANTFCLFSLPLGAVRLTEAFISDDPPRNREIRDLRSLIQEKLGPVARRIGQEKFTMAFGSGGTITALAETDSRLSGDSKAASLMVLRRSRLKALLETLISQPVSERAALISGDPKRADIIIAGAVVLLEVMSAVGLDYLFVSRRGLRDGLTVDLLQKYYSDSGAWHPQADRAESLQQVCQKYLYHAAHAQHVSQLALTAFYQLQKLHQLPEKYAGILNAAAMLHDIGLFISHPKHHKHSYYLIKSSGLNSFSKLDLDLVANIARYHRKAHPSQKHLPFSQLSPRNQNVVRKLSAILRIADAFDFKREQRVKTLSCTLKKSKTLSILATGAASLKDELNWAAKKGSLIEEVFNVDLELDRARGPR